MRGYSRGLLEEGGFLDRMVIDKRVILRDMQ
ncbi:MAG: hypothetical protein Nkreftii_002357 [Candidatus Nitrospira kreftii]|uniref:Uncharacterized protein n=1 Tax=Candidatus Nitrospira kreftii TaxID=2652173 RepID=A0A7S8FEY0_9BACT|nr:MAG: hypothetical protein Nkreftii_002357 [Candidatus Nitrospira kreftii]